MLDYYLSSFTKHPRENNMSYFKHFCFSCNLGIQFSFAALYAFIHACFPFICETTSYDYSKFIHELIERKKYLSDINKR